MIFLDFWTCSEVASSVLYLSSVLQWESRVMLSSARRNQILCVSSGGRRWVLCYGPSPTLIQCQLTQSHAKYLNLTSFTKTYCISYSINIMCCYKYGESWQRKWILPAFKFNNTAWRTCWMWSPKPPAASSSSTKSPLTTGCSSCTTSLPPVFFSSPRSWHLPSEYHLYVD